MSDFSDYYKKLLILQYADKPIASAHINTFIQPWDDFYTFLRTWEYEFDLDYAWGDRLDKIGAIVGRSRIVKHGYAKTYFGFGSTNTKTFSEAPMLRILRDNIYEETELNDTQYRFFIRSKIMNNIVSARMSSNDGDNGLQNAIDFLFKSKAFVVDNKDMSLTLYIDESYDSADLEIIVSENLLPSPQGVGYKNYIQYSEDGTFGFSNNPNTKSFGLGKFARIITI